MVFFKKKSKIFKQLIKSCHVNTCSRGLKVFSTFIKESLYDNKTSLPSGQSRICMGSKIML